LWVGGRFLHSQRKYMWVLNSGKQLRMPSTFRKKLQPSFQHEDTCVEFWPRKPKHWFTEPCAGKFCFLCENRNDIWVTFRRRLSSERRTKLPLRSKTWNFVVLLVVEYEEIKYWALDLYRVKLYYRCVLGILDRHGTYGIPTTGVPPRKLSPRWYSRVSGELKPQTGIIEIPPINLHDTIKSVIDNMMFIAWRPVLFRMHPL